VRVDSLPELVSDGAEVLVIPKIAELGRSGHTDVRQLRINYGHNVKLISTFGSLHDSI
jgi:hypothetical protein